MARDFLGAGIASQTFNLAIRRDSNGYWWNGSSFQSAYTTVTMIETDSTNLLGVYHYDFIPRETDFTATFYVENTVPFVTNDPYVGELVIGYWVDNLDTELSDLATDADIEIVKARLGNSFVDSEFLNMRKLIGQVQDLQKQMFRVLEEIKRK